MVQSTRLFSRRAVMAGGASVAALAPLAGIARAQGKKLDRVNIVNASGNLSNTLDEMLHQQAFLEKFGLTAQATFVSDGNRIMGSLISGDMDICPLSGFSQVFPAVEKGARMKVVSGSVVRGQQTVFSANPAVKAITDLKGKTIGVGGVGSQLHQVMVALLQKNGVDPASVTFANIGSSADVVRAVSAKVVDAGPGQIDFIPQMGKFGVHIVEGGDMWTNLPDLPFQGGFTTDKMIADKREMLVRTLAAYGALFRFLSGPDSRQAWRDARRKSLNGSGAEFDAGSDFQWEFIQKAQPLGVDLVLLPKQIDSVQDMNVAAGAQAKRLPYEQVTDMSLARDAIKLLG